MPIIVLTLVLAAALGGGVSVAADKAVPGDALYGFKVNVNEQVEGALALSPEQRANWDIAAAQKRLDEAQTLASNGSLTADNEAKISANFQTHASDVAQQVAVLQQKGDFTNAADIAARFQSTLAQKMSAMTKVEADAHAQGSLAPVTAKVQQALDSASTLSTEASAKAAISASQGDDSKTKAAPMQGLRIRTEGDANASSSDNSINGSVEGTTKVNIY